MSEREFVVECLNTWSDWPDDWSEIERVATAGAAEAFITAEIEAHYARQVAEYERQKPKADRAQALFQRRKAVLIEAELWKQEGESFIPLLMPHVPCQEPVRSDRSAWRVRTAAEVDEE